jgi:perosamine synthetase
MITTVEGGMVFTDDQTLNRRMRMIRSQGEDPARKYHHIELGHNFRMTELHAAIGLAQLAKLDALLQERRQMARGYDALFSGTALPISSNLAEAGNSYFLYSLGVDHRDEAMVRLKQRGIETRACYPIPLYCQPIFKSARKYSCPITRQTCDRILNPPMFHGLTQHQQQRVAIEIRNVLRELASPSLRKAV